MASHKDPVCGMNVPVGEALLLALVGAALKDLAKRVDVIVLAQASMARVVDSLSPAEKPVPILSSPRLAIEKIAEILKAK